MSLANLMLAFGPAIVSAPNAIVIEPAAIGAGLMATPAPYVITLVASSFAGIAAWRRQHRKPSWETNEEW